MLPLHAASDVCLSSSRNEGLPVALIEAAAAARPSVAIGVGGIPELVVDGVTGLCIRSDATDRELVEGLSGGLLELALSSERRAALGQAAR
ncbi:MAG: glycosyltransferase, partial [Planctomycetota bacterium]